MSQARRVTVVALFGALSMLAAACTDQQPGSPVPQSTTVASSASQVPQVTTPLDATKFLKDPCTILPEDFLTQSNLPVKGEKETTGAVAEHVGPGCYWDNSDVGFSLSISFTVGNKNGLADLYSGHDRGYFNGYWEPTMVQEYPAVFNGPSDDRSGGNCALDTAISNNLVFLANLQDLHSAADPCEWVKRAADQVITTLKASS